MSMPIDYQQQFCSISITTSPMHSTSEPIRKRFMSPKPSSTRKPILRPLATSPLPSVLGKRDYIVAFGDDADEQRYGQKIEDDFFVCNVGQGVFSPIAAEKKGFTAEELQAATDSVIQDFRAEFASRERDSESKYDVDEILEWCEYYRNNRNLFNV